MSKLFTIAVFFVLGVGFGLVAPVPLRVAVATASLSALTVVLAVMKNKLIGPSLVTSVFIAGWIRPVDPGATMVQDPTPPCTRIIEGTVEEPAILLEDYNRLVVQMARWSECMTQPDIPKLSPVQGRLFVWTPPALGSLPERGETVRLRARVKTIVPSRNFGLPRRPPERSMYTAIVTDRGAIALMATADNGFRQVYDRWRSDTAKFLTETLPPKAASCARALLLGQSKALEFGQMERFRRTGTAHLISVSGLHLGLLTLFAFIIANAFFVRTPLARRFDVGRLAALLAIPAAISFALLTGCRTPVVRAAVMATSALLARCIGRNGGTPEALALSAIAILAVDPEALSTPGFQLSFTAVLGFFFALRNRSRNESALSPRDIPPSPWDGLKQRARDTSLRLLFSSVAACAVTTPLVLHHFGYVSLVTVPVNLIAVPLAGFAILPLLLAVLVTKPLLPALAKLLCIPTGHLLNCLDSVLTWISSFPCTLENPGPVTSAGVVSVSTGLLLSVARRRRPGLAALLLGVSLSVTGIFVDPPKIPRGKLTVSVMDVGQGDSILVTSPNGEHILVDAGGTRTGRFDVGEQVVVPALRALGVRRLEVAVVTHFDFDHAGGMASVLKAFDVGELWENGHGTKAAHNTAYEKIAAVSRQKRIPTRRTPALCGVHNFGEVSVTVIHPCTASEAFDGSGSPNSNSLVLVVAFGAIRAALTGDIDRAVETHLISTGSFPPVDILKIPHHGSASSSTGPLLDTLSPGIAAVSLGRFNFHGMPHRSVLHRLKQRDIRLLRTDLMGALRLSTDGRGILISTMETAKSRQSLLFDN